MNVTGGAAEGQAMKLGLQDRMEAKGKVLELRGEDVVYELVSTFTRIRDL